MRSYVALVHEHHGEFVVTFPDLPGCRSSHVATIEEARANAASDLAIHLQALIDRGQAIPPRRRSLKHVRSELQTRRGRDTSGRPTSSKESGIELALFSGEMTGFRIGRHLVRHPEVTVLAYRLDLSCGLRPTKRADSRRGHFRPMGGNPSSRGFGHHWPGELVNERQFSR
jgi:predicted RNase H-like HicB family nuclease